MTRTFSIETMDQVAEAVRQARTLAIEEGYSTFEATRLATAVSELGRNAVLHGKGGSLTLDVIETPRDGIRLTVHDDGPGIADLARALEDGYSTNSGLGYGLGGTQRLLGGLEVTSNELGTRVRGVLWRR